MLFYMLFSTHKVYIRFHSFLCAVPSVWNSFPASASSHGSVLAIFVDLGSQAFLGALTPHLPSTQGIFPLLSLHLILCDDLCPPLSTVDDTCPLHK